jgi:pimeloyl-ACP methyl ester carboxylesterase
MARSGVRVAAVETPGLMAGRFEEGDVLAICDLAQELATESKGPVGMVGFSAGAGLALVAAARPELIGRLDPLILFGAYYSLPALLTEMSRQMRATPSGPTAEDDYIWLLMWSAYADLDNMGLADSEQTELIGILRDFCSGPTPEQKREFFNRVLQSRLPQIQTAADQRHQAQSPEALDRLSPEGKLDKITARVFLLHDLHDSLIPPEHARQIFAELSRRSGPATQQLLVTPLLSHVNARAALRVGDLFRMLGIMGEIVG